uniref:Putative neurotoxin LTDF 07-01 n=1 Tax=Dolomedes fimbriatus TaxID=1432569 RepID=A0A0K1D982_9ARAC|nr:putative neurotoxin LTDF 07-01 [Dolomedes fimbriatus]
MKTSILLALCISAILLLSMVDASNAEEMNSQEVPEERGYCAENGIKCNDLHCCSGLVCKCNSSRSNCVCRKK